MRFSRTAKVAIILAIAAGVAVAQKVGDSMQPRRANTQMFANEIREAYESPIASLGTGDIVTISEVKRNHFRVRTGTGVEGWIEKKELNKASAAAASKNRAFAFEAAEVVGYLDNPTPVYIIDMDDPNADPISLDRSFKDALKENVDRETVERLAR